MQDTQPLDIRIARGSMVVRDVRTDSAAHATLPARLLFFLKYSGALGSHVRFWTPTLTGLNADEAARKVSKRAIMRFTHTTHTHTHQHTRTRPQHPGAGRGFEPPPAASNPRELPTELSLKSAQRAKSISAALRTLTLFKTWDNSKTYLSLSTTYIYCYRLEQA